jgi:hypothetical protein
VETCVEFCWTRLRAFWTKGAKLEIESAPAELGRLVYAETRQEAMSLAVQGHFAVLAPCGHEKWLYFQCPCGCGEMVCLNLMLSQAPKWRIELNRLGQYSVFPSVDSQTCGSHYWIRNGRVDWC